MFRSHSFLFSSLALTGVILFVLFYHLFQDAWKRPLCDSTPLSLRSQYVSDEYTLSVRNVIAGLRSLRLPMNSTMIRPFVRSKAYYRLAPRYNLAYVTVEKSMSALMQAIFCYLYDPTGFIEGNRTISSELYEGRFCYSRNEADSTSEKRLRAPSNPPTIFIARNPYERFVSAFGNKCIRDRHECYGCAEDVLCTLERAHAEIVEVSAKYWDVTISQKAPLNYSFESIHFSPSNWVGDLYDEADNFIFIKYGETDTALNKTFMDLVKVFHAHGVEENRIQYILESVKTRSLHATKHFTWRDKYMKQLTSSPKHIKLLNDLYFYDSQMFGYELLQ